MRRFVWIKRQYEAISQSAKGIIVVSTGMKFNKGSIGGMNFFKNPWLGRNVEIVPI